MVSLLPRQLMLGMITGGSYQTANPAAWRDLAARGLVETRPAEATRDFPVVVSLTAAGRAALQAAKTVAAA